MKTLPSLLPLLLLAAPPVRAAVEFAYRFDPSANIPDFGQYVDSRSLVSPGFASIEDVILELSLAAAPGESMWLGDLFATLTHGTALEDERVAVLLNRPGRDPSAPFGSELGSLAITLDDAAATNVFRLNAPAGTYRPDGRLSVDPYSAPAAFSPGGQTLGQLAGPWLASNRWSLMVADTTPGDTARLVSWTLRLRGDFAPGAPVAVPEGLTARFIADQSGDVTLGSGASVEFSGAMTGNLATAAGGTVVLGPSATLGPLPFALVSGSTLAGTGTVTGPASIEGRLAPGRSPGILTFTEGLALGATSTTSLEIGGPIRGVDYDGVDLVGSGELAYGGTLALVFTAPVASGTYHLFTRQAPITRIGDFALVSFDGSFADTPQVVFTAGTGWTALLDAYHFAFANESGDLVITVIPETASAAGALGLFALGFCFLRRRPR